MFRVCFHQGRRFFTLLVLCCMVFKCMSAACGQGPAAPVDPVRPVLNLQGPAGDTFALGFAGTPNRIYAAGTGKTVDVWDLERNPDGTIRTAIMAESIRWPVSRGNFGVVNTVALSAKGQWLAVGGSATRGYGCDLALFDLKENQFHLPLPQRDRPPSLDSADASDRSAHWPNPTNPSGNFQTNILSLAASAGGTYLASSGTDGQVWLWRGGVGRLIGPQIDGTQLQASQAANTMYWPITFAGPARVVFASATEVEGNYHLRVHDINTGKTGLFNKTVYRRGVTALAATPDGKVVVSADMDGQIVVNAEDRQWSGTICKVAKDDPRVAISAVAITGDGQRVAVCGETAAGKSYILILETQTLKALDVFESRNQLNPGENQFRHNAVAFDPLGRQLLANDNENLTLLVWQLTDPQGNWLQKPLSQTQPFQISGRGSMVRTAAFLSDRSCLKQGYSFSITTTTNGPQAFDASQGRLEPLEQPKAPLQSDGAFAKGWRIEHTAPNIYNQQRITLTDGNGNMLERTLNVALIGRYGGIHAFLATGNGKPFAVAIATQRTDLIHVLGLSDGLPILRTFRGHGGEPLALSCSTDGRYLLSNSRDCTVRIWSLEHLEGSPVPTDQTIYGASLQVTPAGVVVQNVAKAGIAHARGLRDGDVIQRIDGTVKKKTPEEIHEFLLKGEPEPFFRELIVHFLRGDKAGTAIFFPAWRELLTFVFDRTGEWAVFTSEGYFNASRAGQNLFGWQLNRERNQSVRFEKAAALQKEFEKPDVINKVLKLGNVPDALAAFNLAPEANVAARIEELPEIQLSSVASLTPQPEGAQIEILAKVKFTKALKPGDLDLQATNNGRHLPDPVIVPAADGSQTQTFKWTLVSAEQVHAVSVGYREKNKQVVDSRQSTRQLNFASTAAAVNEPGQMFLIGLAGSNYRNLQKLAYPGYGLDELKKQLTALQYRQNANADRILKDNQITPEQVDVAILETLKAVRKRQNPNDLIVFCATGHGEVYQDEFCFIPPQAPIIPPPQGAELNEMQEINNYQVSIPWSRIAKPLNEAPCHVLWVVDACYSGQAQSDAAHKAAIRESAGIHAMRQVLWSSSPEETSLEDLNWQFESNKSGHGAFTLALLEALTGRVVFPTEWDRTLKQFQNGQLDRNRTIDRLLELKPEYDEAEKDAQALRQDRQIDFAEIAGYVTQRVQKLAQDHNKRQTPIGFPVRYQTGISSAPSLVLEILP